MVGSDHFTQASTSATTRWSSRGSRTPISKVIWSGLQGFGRRQRPRRIRSETVWSMQSSGRSGAEPARACTNVPRIRCPTVWGGRNRRSISGRFAACGLACRPSCRWLAHPPDKDSGRSVSFVHTLPRDVRGGPRLVGMGAWSWAFERGPCGSASIGSPRRGGVRLPPASRLALSRVKVCNADASSQFASCRFLFLSCCEFDSLGS